MPKQEPLNLGFIGGSLNSAVGYAHFVAATMDNKWRVAAGCFSLDADRNLDAGSTYGVASERVYGGLHEMLLAEKGKIDAVVVLTPTPLHLEHVLICLEEGYPVICEKSLATNSAEAAQILAMREAKNGFLALIYNYSGYPMIRELRAMIRSGYLGKILHYHAEMPQEGYIRVDEKGLKPTPQAWRISDATVPTIHLDLAIHLHELLYYLVGSHPERVVSDQRSYGWFSGVVDDVTCLSHHANDIRGVMWFSKSALGHRNGLRLRLYGAKASAEWSQADPEHLLVSHADGRREILDRAGSVTIANLRRYNRFKAGHPAGFIEALANLYTDIAGCLRQYKVTGTWKSEEVFSAELAVQALQFFEAMVASVNEKCWKPVTRDS